MIRRVSKTIPPRRRLNMLGTSPSSNIDNSVIRKPGSRLLHTQMTSSRTPISSTAKAVPRYAQSTQSASSRTIPNIVRRKALECHNIRENISTNSVQKRLTDTRSQKQQVAKKSQRTTGVTDDFEGQQICADRDSINLSDLSEFSHMQCDFELLKRQRYGGMIAACPRYGTTEPPHILRVRLQKTKRKTSEDGN